MAVEIRFIDELVVTIDRKGFDYVAELKFKEHWQKFHKPITQEFGGVNPDDAYSSGGGYTDENIERGVVEWFNLVAKDILKSRPFKIVSVEFNKG